MKGFSFIITLLFCLLLTACGTTSTTTTRTANNKPPALDDYNMRTLPSGGEDAALAAAKTY